MNRAQRRAHLRWQQQMQALFRDAAGVLALQVIRVGGPQPSDKICAFIAHWAEMVAASEQGALCLCCPTGINITTSRPAAFVIIEPARDDPSTASVSVVCPGCARRSDDELMAAVATQMRGRMLPAQHVHAGGQA